LQSVAQCEFAHRDSIDFQQAGGAIMRHYRERHVPAFDRGGRNDRSKGDAP